MKTVLAWLWAGIWQVQRGRALTAVAAVAIGVALGLAIHLVNASALDEFGRAIAVVNGDAQAQLVATAGRFDESLYPEVAADPNIDAVSPVIDAEVSVATPGASPSEARQPLRVLGIDPLAASRVTPSLMPAADTPQASAAQTADAWFADDAIFLSRAAMRKLAVSPGDTLRVRVGLSWVALTVRGEVPGAAAEQALAVMDIGTMQWRLGWIGHLSRLDLRIAPGADLKAIDATWQARSQGALKLSTPDNAGQRMSNLSRAYRVNLNVLSLVALFTGGFIVYSTLSLALARQRTTLAILGVLGAPARLPAIHVLGQGLSLGLMGSMLGAVAGIAIASLMLAVLGGDLGGGYFSGDTPALFIDPMGLALYGLSGIAAGVAGAMQPAWVARGLSPARALKGAAPGPGGRRRLAWPIFWLGLGGILLWLPPVEGLPIPSYLAIAAWLLGGIAMVPTIVALSGRLLALAEHGLARMLPWWLAAHRLAASGGSAAGALSGVVASFALASAMAVMVSSFRHSVDDWLSMVLPADLYARAGTAGGAGALDPAMQSALASMPGVARVEFLRVRELTLDPARPPVALLARPVDRDHPGARLPLTGSSLAVADGVAPIWVSEAMVDLYGWHPGKQVTIPLGDGARASTLFVAGVWRDYARQHGAIAIDAALYQALTGDTSVTDLGLWLDPGQDANALLDRIRNALPAIGTLDWRSATDIRALSLRIFDRSFAVTYVLEAIALVIGLFGVTATFAGESLARAREFGMLRHLGTTRRQIGMQLAAESVLLLIAGCLWGLCVGLAIAWVLIARVNPQSFHWTMDVSWPVPVLIVSAATLVMAGTAAAVLAGRQAMGATPVRAVREDW